jgi:LysR family transcriptional regulator, low CO2-responsive transcriptional regulator
MNWLVVSMDLIDLRRLRVLWQVVESGGVTAAAEQLAVSQSDVTFHIKQLEREVGLSLLVRQGRRVVPTEAGLMVARSAQAVLNEMYSLQRAVADFREGRAGAIRLGASMTIGDYLLPPLVAAFHQDHPGIRVTVRVDRTPTICDAIRDGELDFGYVVLSNMSDQLLTEPVYQDELVLLASPGFAARLPLPITPSDLTKLPFIATPKGMQYRDFVDTWLHRFHVLSLNVVAEAGSTTGLLNMATASLGATYCFRIAAQQAIADGSLCVLPVRGIRLTHTFCLVYRKRQGFSPIVQSLLDRLRKHGRQTLSPDVVEPTAMIGHRET